MFVRCLALVILPSFYEVQAPRLAAPAQPPLSKPFHPQADLRIHYTTKWLDDQVSVLVSPFHPFLHNEAFAFLYLPAN